jgi:non-heme chloroperoxidase
VPVWVWYGLQADALTTPQTPMFTATDGARIAYHVTGTGIPTIVLLHGWQADSSVWGPVADRLASSHHVVSVDLRGFGESRNAPGPYTVQQFSDDIAVLLGVLGLARVVLVGHSMGGAIAQRFAVDHPSALAGIVLVAPVPASGLQMSPRAEAMFRAATTDPDTALKWLGMLTLRPLPADRFDVIVRAAGTALPHVAIEAFDSWTRVSFEDQARTITVPTLVIAGAADRPQTPDFLRERVAKIIPGARMTVVDEAGHYVQMEQPEGTAELIHAFARDVAGG